MEMPGIRKADLGISSFVPLPPIGLYTHRGPDVLHMPSCKGFLSFFSFLFFSLFSASHIPGLENDNLPPLQQDNDITTSIREASKEVDSMRQAKRASIQGQTGTKEHDNTVRQQCKPIQYSNKILKHFAPLWELGLNN